MKIIFQCQNPIIQTDQGQMHPIIMLNNKDFVTTYFMIFYHLQNITKNIIEALNRMSTERKETIDHSVPRILKRTFESYAGVKGSKMYDSFSNGTLTYLSTCLQKPV